MPPEVRAGNDDEIGGAAVEDEGLLAGELEAVAGFFALEARSFPARDAGLRQPRALRSICPRNLRRYFFFCASEPRAAAPSLRSARVESSGEGGEGAAGLFEHQAQRLITEAGCRRSLRDKDAAQPISAISFQVARSKRRRQRRGRAACGRR